jgi:hypothetical protein
MTALRIIKLLLEATYAGRIKWQKNRQDGDRYESTLGGESLTVRFVRFARTDRLPPDRHLAELDAFGVTTDHAVGTEGMELICQMLAHNDPAWADLRTKIRGRIAEAEEYLHTLLDPEPARLAPQKSAKKGRAMRVPVRVRALSR